MLKNSLFGILLLFLVSCESSDDYDPIAQLASDIALIEQYVMTEGLTVQIDDSGLRYIINQEGSGVFPQPGEIVRVNYELFLFDGSLIDTNIEQTARNYNVYNSQRNYTPLQFRIEGGGVIEGFDIGTQLLSLEGDGTFLVPSVLAYRNTGSPSGAVPPNTNLIFNIELAEID